MRSANILALVATALWAAMLWVGVDLLKGVVAQHVLGYPAADQFDFLVGIPFAAIVAVGGTTLLVNALNRFWVVSHLVSGVALIALLPYLFVYGGGV
jgi:hypothetical protein